jgi:steroid delta-isomerase
MAAKHDNPAMLAAHDSWRCVMGKLKDEWFDLMADDVRIEDPIGKAPTNPTGEGIAGREGLEKFWTTNIEPTSAMKIVSQESYAAGLESAHVLTLTVEFANGLTTQVRGIFTYRVNDSGKITNLRGYWGVDEMQFTQASAPA